MTIHQIQIQYDEIQDRLLLRLSTTDDCEFRFWLTRRFTKRLWNVLVQMLEWDRAVNQQLDPDIRRSVLDLQHEGYTRQADYTQKFRAHAQGTPPRLVLGEAPVLLAKADGRKQADGVQILSLNPVDGQGVDITLDTPLLHIFTRLLREQASTTAWDMDLALYEGSPQTTSADARPRRLN